MRICCVVELNTFDTRQTKNMTNNLINSLYWHLNSMQNVISGWFRFVKYFFPLPNACRTPPYFTFCAHIFSKTYLLLYISEIKCVSFIHHYLLTQGPSPTKKIRECLNVKKKKKILINESDEGYEKLITKKPNYTQKESRIQKENKQNDAEMKNRIEVVGIYFFEL